MLIQFVGETRAHRGGTGQGLWLDLEEFVQCRI